MLDPTDLKILALLQRDARISNAAIARRVGLSPSATLGRIRKLEQAGVIRGYEARLNEKEFGLGLVAFVFVRGSERTGALRTAERLAAFPEVQEVHHIAGEDCFLVKVRAENTEALGWILRGKFGAISTIVSTRTTIVLETVKEISGIPLPATKGKKERHGRG